MNEILVIGAIVIAAGLLAWAILSPLGNEPDYDPHDEPHGDGAWRNEQ